jgi:hypothetical protein
MIRRLSQTLLVNCFSAASAKGFFTLCALNVGEDCPTLSTGKHFRKVAVQLLSTFAVSCREALLAVNLMALVAMDLCYYLLTFPTRHW